MTVSAHDVKAWRNFGSPFVCRDRELKKRLNTLTLDNIAEVVASLEKKILTL